VVDRIIYRRVFKGEKDGALIFADMRKRFSDRLSFKAGAPDETAFREGQRSVIKWLESQIEEDEANVICADEKDIDG